MINGRVNINGPSGRAELATPVCGPKSGATVILGWRKSALEWTFLKLVVEIEVTGVRIYLLKKAQPMAAVSLKTHSGLSATPI